MKRFRVALFLILSLSLVVQVFSQSDVVAVVNGRAITIDEWNREANVQKLLTEIKATNEVFYDVLVNTQEGQKLLDVYKLKVLDVYIRKILFIQFAESLKVAPKDEDVKRDVDTEIAKMLADLKMTEQQLNDYLIQLGMGKLEDYKQRLYLQRAYSLSLANVYLYYLRPTEEEIARYYEQNKAKFTTPTTYELILFRVRDQATAESIRQDLIKTNVGAEVAQKYGITDFIDGTVVQDDTSKIPQAVWAYIKNAVRGVPIAFTVGSDRYVLKVKNVRIGGTKTLEQAREEIIKELTAQRQQVANEAVKKAFDEFVSRSKIELRIKK
ncbi:peptidyl-prolyl cis-trans isomerase [Fervidobacterium thailandense]|uniref:peptidylprolyl isomerase n=1 Tax=Fervidobacterium thailandense TaxID=1008305 RepID=A0A1E3G4V0_9BACT|nr:peptidyl-prolyl cis-trans isomerase [Fervidobacterium thailandense]ODN31259.1 hypothetical protein A4H02_00290 [Fervidobacterium thailandense]